MTPFGYDRAGANIAKGDLKGILTQEGSCSFLPVELDSLRINLQLLKG